MQEVYYLAMPLTRQDIVFDYFFIASLIFWHWR